MSLHNILYPIFTEIMEYWNIGVKRLTPLLHCSSTPVICIPLKSTDKLFILLTAILILPGCSKSRVMSEDKFMKVYVDLVVAQDTSNAPITKFDSVKAIVFKHNGITKDEYDATIDYYNKDPQKWQDFFRKTTMYVDKLRSQNLPKTIQKRK